MLVATENYPPREQIIYKWRPLNMGIEKPAKPWDFNALRAFGGEGEIWTLATLITPYSLSRGAPSASWVLLQAENVFAMLFWRTSRLSVLKWRRERDSNPRCFRTTVFRTVTIDHSDISPFRPLCHSTTIQFFCQFIFPMFPCFDHFLHLQFCLFALKY